MKKDENLLKLWPKILKADKEYCKRGGNISPLSAWFVEYVRVPIEVAPLMSKREFFEFVISMPNNDAWAVKLKRALNIKEES